MSRYTPSRNFLRVAILALALAAGSLWLAQRWPAASAAAIAGFAISAAAFYLGSRPPVEIDGSRLVIGKRQVPIEELARIDRTGWFFPLILRMKLRSGAVSWLVFPGSPSSIRRLLRQLYRAAHGAVIDGMPNLANSPMLSGRAAAAAPRPRLLLEEDEAEIERLYLRLKTVGRLDPKNTGEEK
jgi:hypothetical protein